MYMLSGFGFGSYIVTPSKTGGGNGAISSFDAAKVAQHVAGINALTGNPLIVADVSGNGMLWSFDAGRIARYAVGLAGFGSTGNWLFSPARRTYTSVNANITGQDYSALLMGEVFRRLDEWWFPTGKFARAAAACNCGITGKYYGRRQKRQSCRQCSRRRK